MPRYKYIQNAFNSGEITPKLEARTDVAEFQTGLEEMKNFLPYSNGGASFRRGFELATSIDYEDINSDDTTNFNTYNNNEFWATSFIFNQQEKYEFVFHYFEGSTSSFGSNVLTAYFRKPEGSFTRIDIAAVGTYSFLGENLKSAKDAGFNVSSGWHFAQKNDILIATHYSGLVPPLLIARNSIATTDPEFIITDWELGVGLFSGPISDVLQDKVSRYPTFTPNNSDVTLQVDTKSGSGTATASSALFTGNHVGSIFHISEGEPDSNGHTSGISFRVTSTSGTEASPSTTATVTIERVESSFTINNPLAYWFESSWGKRYGWPRVCAFFESRLFFGASRQQPSTVWASAQDDFSEFFRYQDVKGPIGFYSRDPFAGNALELTIASSSLDAITSMASSQSLIVATSSKEYLIDGGNQAILASTVRILPQSSEGSKETMPAQFGNATVFITRDGKGVYTLGYKEDNNAFVNTNVSLLSDEIIYRQGTRSDRFKKLAYQSSRNTIWGVTEEGYLVSLTINPATKTRAFSYHPMSDTEILDVYTIPNPVGDYEEVRLVVNETTNTAGFPFIITMPDDFENTSLFTPGVESFQQGLYLDYGVVATSGIFTNTWFYDDRMEGATVSAYFTDGTQEDGLTVDASGNVTTTKSDTQVFIGKPYDGKLKTLNMEVGANQLLNSQGDVRRIDQVTPILYKSWAGKVSVEHTSLNNDAEVSGPYDIEIDETKSNTGRLPVEVPGSPELENKFIIENKGPLPLNVLGIVMRGQYHG